MLFTSISFLLFLPIVFAVYWLLHRHLNWQNVWLVVASYAFYGWWDPRFLCLIILTSLCSYAFGLLIERCIHVGQTHLAWLCSAANIILNLAVLGLFSFEGNIRQLCALAQACNACHVELVFVATPVTAAYLRHIPQGQKRLLAQTYDCFRRRYAVRIADYSADTRFADSDFYDADHLSDRGAARLTHLLTATEADSTYK